MAAAATSAAEASGAANAVCNASQQASPRISRCEREGVQTERASVSIPLRS